MTTDKQKRKETPLQTGLLDYFPRGCAAVANCSFLANEQHNPGEPMHWAREKSGDHVDCAARHNLERGTTDDDGITHAAKAAWRALAALELEMEVREGEDIMLADLITGIGKVATDRLLREVKATKP